MVQDANAAPYDGMAASGALVRISVWETRSAFCGGFCRHL